MRCVGFLDKVKEEQGEFDNILAVCLGLPCLIIAKNKDFDIFDNNYHFYKNPCRRKEKLVECH